MEDVQEMTLVQLPTDQEIQKLIEEALMQNTRGMPGETLNEIEF